ncbi:Hypothetical predicted protein [Lecanosticta acicola]|uniref:CWH43-like N-terminal domain-containing protein n=1 Tax=Lecanosticta acicola TaxID=111012 RepID=A0AAI9EBE4_9PEZI|nr:Hypothetical predicted protein [Lecanosticta acicola]
MQTKQSLAYISDVGASEWGKPLFITGSAITVCSFSAAFFTERWLRHKGLLIHASSFWGSTMSVLASFFTLMGAAGLMNLTIWDARNHTHVHDPSIGVFIGGYLLAAIFMCLEKHRISLKFPSNPLIRRSYIVKLCFILIELGLTAIFGCTALTGFTNLSVVFEWFVALFFIFYMWSFAMDFLPIPGTLGMGVGMQGTEVEIGLDNDQVELVGDSEKLWELELVSVQRPGTAWGGKRVLTTRTKTLGWDDGMDGSTKIVKLR